MKSFCAMMGLVVLAAAANAQELLPPRSVSMGGVSISTSANVDAIGTNPANLFHGDQSKFVIEFLPSNFYFDNNVVDIAFYNKYFTGDGQTTQDGKQIGRFLTSSDKSSIMNAFPDSLGAFAADVDSRVIGISCSLGNVVVGIAVDETAGSQLVLPNSILFPLNGNTPGAMTSLDKLSGSAWWYTSYSFTAAVSFEKLPGVSASALSGLAIGATPKYVAGNGYASVSSHGSSVYTDPATYNCSVSLGVSSQQSGIAVSLLNPGGPVETSGRNVLDPFNPAGSGIGMDFGISTKIFRLIQFGVSVTNVGKVQWTRDNRTMSVDTTIIYSGYAARSPQDVDVAGAIDSVRNVITTAFRTQLSTSREFSTPLPTRAGVSISFPVHEVIRKFPGQLLVAIEYRCGLNNSLGNTTTPVYAVGTEWRPVSLIPIRTGLRIIGNHDISWSAGTGLNTKYWDLDFGLGDLNPLLNMTTAKRICVAFSALKFKL